MSSLMSPARSLSLAVALSLAGCAPTRGDDPHPGDATVLAGAWDLVVHRAGEPDLLARLILAPSSPGDATVPVALRGATLEGVFRLHDTAWLTATPVDSGVSAYVDADSSVVVYLRLQGRCSNCGNLGLAGRWTGGEISGHWVLEFSSHPPEGSFTLRRPAEVQGR